MRVSGLKQGLNMWRKVWRATGEKPGGSILRGRAYVPSSAEMDARAKSKQIPFAVDALERSLLVANAEGNLKSSWKTRGSPQHLCQGLSQDDFLSL